MRIGLSEMIRSRVNSAVEWRVIQEFDKERQVIERLQESYVAIGLEYETRVRALEERVITLTERLAALESGVARS